MSELDILKAEVERLKNENQALVDLIAQLRRKQYGKSSEKVSSEQLGIFDESEVESLKEEPNDDEEKIVVPEHERSKCGKRLKIPESIPREIVTIDLNEIYFFGNTEFLKP